MLSFLEVGEENLNDLLTFFCWVNVFRKMGAGIYFLALTDCSDGKGNIG